MGLRRADARFILPQHVERAIVLGLPEWREALEEAGIEVVRGAEGEELVIAAAERADAALALRPRQLLLVAGRPWRRLRSAGWSAQAVQPLPDLERPELLVPLGQRAAVAYALRRRSSLSRARLVGATELLARGVAAPGRPVLTAAARNGARPFLVRAAEESLGLDAAEWFFAFDPWAQRFTRGALHLFRTAEKEPAWVLKFARVPGLAELFDRDEQGLRLAARSPVVALHAPKLVGRLEVAGLHASVETAAVGTRLPTLLALPRRRAERLAAVERVADWVVRVGVETASRDSRLQADLQRLDPAFATELAQVPAVFSHGDLVGENVIVTGEGFTVLDWESAREHGSPLWDLLSFLTGSLAALDGLEDESRREEHFARLWRGELPSSEVLFRWTRRAVEAGGIPPQAVGPLATVLWQSYARLDEDMAERLELAESRPREREPATVRFVRRWLADPLLGPGWDRWRG